MEDILKQTIKESLGKEGEIILLNNWKYFGKITNIDENYVEILDYKYNKYHIIKYDQIKDFIRSAN